MAKRILLIERDPALRDALAFSLGLEGFDVQAAGALERDHLVRSLGPADCLIFAHEPGDADALDACSSVASVHGALSTIVLATNPTRSLRKTLDGIGAHLVEKPLIGSTLSDLLRSIPALRRAN